MKSGLNIIPVSMVDEVISNALTSEPLPVEIENGKQDQALAKKKEEPRGEIVKH